MGVGNIAPSELRDFRRRLLAWYERHQRDLPWRRPPADPYRTLLAEAMLQQTQVATVIPYYNAFLKRFPNVRALARAGVDEVLLYWAGLGYYRRCHHLHAAARWIVKQNDGRWPDNVDSLRALPGVGRYTAGAVASIAFGRRTPAVDGNVKRVLGRWFGLRDTQSSALTENRIWTLAEQLISRRRPGDFNQALMELGSRVCRPRGPHCDICPIKHGCSFFKNGPVALAIRKNSAGIKEQTLVTLALEREECFFYRRRPSSGLWAGLWEWPTASPLNGESPEHTARRLVAELISTGERTLHRLPALHHRLSHRLITFLAWRVCLPKNQTVRADGQWIRRGQEVKTAISSAQRKLLSAFGPCRAD